MHSNHNNRYVSTNEGTKIFLCLIKKLTSVPTLTFICQVGCCQGDFSFCFLTSIWHKEYTNIYQQLICSNHLNELLFCSFLANFHRIRLTVHIETMERQMHAEVALHSQMFHEDGTLCAFSLYLMSKETYGRISLYFSDVTAKV